jgi:Mg-chelatase subunit ChlD
MMKIGACQDTNSLRAALARNARLNPELITYDGVFNETYLPNATTDQLLDVVLHAGRGRRNELLLGLEVVSALDGKPRPVDSPPLDLVVAIDTSGSMSSRLVDGGPKLEAAKDIVVRLTQVLRPEDRLGIVVFCATAVTKLEVTPVRDIAGAMDVRALLGDVRAEGCENVPVGLSAAYEMARKCRGEKSNRLSRVLFVSDMSVSEAARVAKDIRELSIPYSIKHGIAVTYLGLGSDFNAALTEEITTASGSNYFAILSPDDFEQRIAK